MAYSKKYTSTANPNSFVFLTWESGYKNVRLYHQKRLIASAEPKEIKAGYSTEDEILNKIELNFSSERPIIINVTIDGDLYAPESIIAKKEKFTGLVGLFGTLAFLSVLGTWFTLSFFDYQLTHPLVKTQFIIDVITILVYTSTAFLISKHKLWAYYLGGITFILMSLLYGLSIYMTGFPMLGVFIFLLRVAIIVYIASFFNQIRLVSQAGKRNETRDVELLDDL